MLEGLALPCFTGHTRISGGNRMKSNSSSFLHRAVVFAATVLLLAGCGGNGGGSGSTNPSPASQGDLVSSVFLNTTTQSQAASFLTGSDFTGVTAKYDVDNYKITYKTLDAGGNLINASGLVCVPRKPGMAASPLVSIQHGTITLHSDAPSALSLRASGTGIVAASLGYIAAMPDYLGYGDSSNTFHPYQHASTLASATVDMVRAARKFLSLPTVSVALNGQLFLTGYSEGGYATLATQKLMESLPTEFSITASEPGAGSYDMINTAITILNESVLPEPALAAFFVKAYDAIYGLNRIASIFQAPYVNVVNTYFDGTRDIHTISMALTSDTASLFSTQFLTDFRGSGETNVKAVIAENNIYDWAPKSPTRLFHGVDDDIVPYANATTAFNAMTANGAANVSLQQCDAGNGVPTTHVNCSLPYLRDVVSYFGSLAGGL